MSETGYFLIAITSLATAVVTLWFKNERTHKRYLELTNENLLKMTNAMVTNARAQEHLANSIDNFPERIVDKMLANGFEKKRR